MAVLRRRDACLFPASVLNSGACGFWFCLVWVSHSGLGLVESCGAGWLQLGLWILVFLVGGSPPGVGLAECGAGGLQWGLWILVLFGLGFPFWHGACGVLWCWCAAVGLVHCSALPLSYRPAGRPTEQAVDGEGVTVPAHGTAGRLSARHRTR